MPVRLLRDWTDSAAVNSLSAEAERMFVRLIQKADDFGRYTADLKLLRPYLFPLQLESTREASLERWLHELESARLVRRYVVGGKPYLEIEKFGQRIRSDVSRYPDPPPAGDCPTGDGTPPSIDGTPPSCASPPRPETETESIFGDGDGDERAVKRKRRPPATGPVAVYHRAFVARFGVEPAVSRPDAIAANGLPPDEAEALILAYVADDDPWVEKQGHALRFITGQINRLRLKLAGKIPATVSKGHARPLATAKDFETFPEGFLVRREEA